ncbi:OmpA family protein [Mesorhizobium sp. LHD-90]|uniref:OmpA family protein n=1 Tax=Mesorhizobium sp. LHD-90 TaxID=3071414 RepID=UPI0027DEF192|nr:OmpA family protein [Mesorhizobium sp. LHD-90]MDQ6438119.1 OmpA family protein [Mesorhizobium sp. LHD-90]
MQGFAASSSSAADTDWTLDPASSVLTYQSVKKNTVIETNQIRNLEGTLSAQGDAKVVFDLNSVDTGVDLRNVRMRFLFFETYKFPVATVTAKVDPAAFADLPSKRRMTTKIPFVLNLHGVDKEYQAELIVTMITDTSVSIASKSPVAVRVEDFGLLPNVEKLQVAANVTNIVPIASVSFDFIFNNGQAGVSPTPVASVAAEGAGEGNAVPASTIAAVGPVKTDESKQAYTDEECVNRFDVLSRTGAIYFRRGSARLDPESRPVLATVLDVVAKCPNLKVEISGHTDADGSVEENRTLSLRRATAVAGYIQDAGVPSARIATAGYGEDRPIAANDSEKNKALNRRIEFSASSLVQ